MTNQNRTPNNMRRDRQASVLSMLEWTEVDTNAVAPSVRYRAVSDDYEYRIFYDPEGQSVQFPPGATGEWWLLVVRARGASGEFDTHVHHAAYRDLDPTKRDAQSWAS